MSETVTAIGAALYFDPETEQGLRALWQRLADEGLGRTMLDAGLRPHLTLMMGEARELGPLALEFRALAATVPTLPVELSAVGAFPGTEGVIYLAPTPTAELLALHADLHGRLDRRGCRLVPYYRPGRWVPHCTVAGGLAPHQMPAAVAACLRADVFKPAWLVELVLGQLAPLREVCTCPLQGMAR